MHHRIRTVVALLLLILAAAGARAAEYLPPQDPQLRIETGMHTAGIWRLDVSADGKLLVTSAEDKTIRLWSTDDGRLLRVFRVPIALGAEGKLYSAAISPDGRMVAAAGWDTYFWKNYWTTHTGHYIYLFDTVSGSLIRRVGPVPTVVHDLEFSADGQRLAAGLAGIGGGVRVWNAPFTEQPFYDTDYKENIFGVAFAPDDSLAVTSYDGFVRLYGADFRLIAKKAMPSGTSPRAAAFSSDGKRLAITQYHTIGADIVSAQTLEPITRIDMSAFNNADVRAAVWSNDGQTLYMAGGYADSNWDYPIIAWKDGQTRLFKEADAGPQGGINDLKAMPGGGVAYASHDPSFGIFDASGKLAVVRQQVTADMRNKYAGYFFNSPDATSVWFGLKMGAVDPWLFDVNRLSFDAAPNIPAGFIQPITDTLPIENWDDATQPTLDKQVLKMQSTSEMARSLAIATDKQSFVIGSDWAVTRFDGNGTQLWRNYPESFVWGVALSADAQIIVAALGDGTLRWYRASDGALLLSFFVTPADHKWIAWTPTGYYAASAGGEDLIGWHFNGKGWDDPPDFFPASRLREQFYRPDVVQLVLKLKDEAVAIETANNLGGQKTQGTGEVPSGTEGIRGILPGIVEFAEDVLELETDKPDIQLRYRVRSPSGRPITRIEILIDGRPVTPRGVVGVDESADAKVLTLNVPQRDSEVTLIAYIDDQPGVPVTMPIKWKGRVQIQKKPRLFALLVGVSKYDNTDLKLNYAAKDASDLEVLLKAQKGVYYDDVDVKLLLNGDATEDAIEIELAKLRKKSAPEDNVIVFMAGHGLTDAAQDFYFLPTSVDLSPDMLSATAIDGDIIRKGLSKIPGKVTLFMDACNAGAGIEGGVSKVDMSGLANSLSSGASLVMFASSTGREVSYEGPQWENGAFTEALLSILGDPNAYGADGKLSISEIDEELTTRVEILTDGKQTPVMTKPGAVKRFFLAAL
ncbi:MAG: caspase family protein [Rhizobiales bacterium]|nr:caspase family protein [Hyphomicrobiales bacterium]